MSIHQAHIRAIEAVNNAMTQAEHDAALTFLRGFRKCLDLAQYPGSGLIACDNHYLDQGIDRPMCAGVFLDWEPTA